MTDSMRLPTFLVLGAAKAGTTALYEQLGSHPDIYMAPRKETNYFALMESTAGYQGPGDAETINALSITREADYAAQFANVTDERAIGEASPLYLYDPDVPVRLRARIPDVRLVAILRHPAERAYSAFLHTRRDGREPVSDFEEALALEDERVDAGWEHLWHYRRMGFYGAQLRRYHELFPAEQIKVLLYDDFCTNPEAFLASILRFLGVDDGLMPRSALRTCINVSRLPGTPRMPDDVRTKLTRLYRHDLRVLEALLGRRLDMWRHA